MHSTSTHCARTRFVRFLFPALLVASGATTPSLAQAPPRPIPDTRYGTHVWNDQITPFLTPAQRDFVARRYAGTQKQTRVDADLYRAINPDFLVLHYRLGAGLGYRATSAPCTPNGGYLGIIDGTWVQEWPGDTSVAESWFFHYGGQRVLQCQWGWYLMELSNASWRTWWSDRVLAQLEHNDADGLFADSFVVPNFMGGFNPALPGIDLVFEAAWSARLEGFMDYVRGRFAGQKVLVPNVGYWVTTRDVTDYGHADGVFIEGFGLDAWENWGEEAFTTQGDRLLGLIQQDKIVIGQSYSNYTAAARMYTLANYLLIKGKHTFLNFEQGQEPEWFPEYEIPLGAPLGPTPSNCAALWDAAKGVYTRAYSNGRVFLNPGTSTKSFALGGSYWKASPSGGGTLPANGVPPASWQTAYTNVSALTLAPGEGAVVLNDPTPYELQGDLVFAGQPATVRVHGAVPGSSQYFFFNRGNEGATFYAPLALTLGLVNPRLGAIRTADAAGEASWTFTLPAVAAGANLGFQAAQLGATTQVVHAHAH